jgi:hypothetical protein
VRDHDPEITEPASKLTLWAAQGWWLAKREAGKTAARYGVQVWPAYYYLLDQSGKIDWGGGHELPEDSRIEALLHQTDGAEPGVQGDAASGNLR